MYTLEILDIDENTSDYEKYKGYEIDEERIFFIGDKRTNSRIGIIKNKNEEIKFIFNFNYVGVLPKIIFNSKTKLIFLGAYDKVFCINTDNYRVLKQVNYGNDIVFFDFIELEDKILIIFEMSIYMINDKGDIIWFYGAPEIKTDYNIEKTKLKIKFFNLNYTTEISLDTGK